MTVTERIGNLEFAAPGLERRRRGLTRTQHGLTRTKERQQLHHGFPRFKQISPITPRRLRLRPQRARMMLFCDGTPVGFGAKSKNHIVRARGAASRERSRSGSEESVL